MWRGISNECRLNIFFSSFDFFGALVLHLSQVETDRDTNGLENVRHPISVAETFGG